MAAHINITNEMAQVVCLIAKRHPESAIAIDWHDGEPEMFWFVTADDGANQKTYVVDDESGTWAPLSDDEAAKFHADELVFSATQ
jgi:hypothetical protein